VGGKHTTGCDEIVPDGWSARFMWHEQGQVDLYLYHQDRRSGCGDTYRSNPPSGFARNRWCRITERVVVNTPGARDGLVEVWYDGRKSLSLPQARLRGNVGAGVALVDAISLQTFYGGDSRSWAPPHATHAAFAGFHLLDSLPDFSVPFGGASSTVARESGFLRPPAPGGPRMWKALGFDAAGRLRLR
jgi:hypothetical protein